MVFGLETSENDYSNVNVLEDKSEFDGGFLYLFTCLLVSNPAALVRIARSA